MDLLNSGSFVLKFEEIFLTCFNQSEAIFCVSSTILTFLFSL